MAIMMWYRNKTRYARAGSGALNSLGRNKLPQLAGYYLQFLIIPLVTLLAAAMSAALRFAFA